MNLFKACYKLLRDDIPDKDLRFAQAIVMTCDLKVDLKDHPQIVKKWLRRFGYTYQKRKFKT